MIDRDKRPGEKTADGHLIVDGMRVWTSDLQTGRIDLSNAVYDGPTLCFRVIEDRAPNGRGVLQSSDMVSVKNPFNGLTA